MINKQIENIKDIEVSNKVQKDINNTLHKEIQDSKIQFKKELDVISKEHRAEIKSLRKDLGEVTKENIKLKERSEQTLETNIEEHHFSIKSPQITSNSSLINNINSSSLITSKPSPLSMLGLNPLMSAPPVPGQSSSSTASVLSSATSSSNRPALAACCSPRTPPGTPPTCRDSTSTPTPIATHTPPQPLKTLKHTESNFKEAQSEVNDMEILDISEDETDNAEDMIDRELLEELDAIARKAYDEDTYSDVDPESYPDYYWQMEYEDEDG